MTGINGEEEPQRRNRTVDGRRADAVRGEMQLEKPQVLIGRGVRRSLQEDREILDCPDVVLLRLLTEITQRHVFDHALPQQADALIGHGILLSEPRLLTPDLQTGRAVSLPRSHQSQAPPDAQRSTARAVSFFAPERSSGGRFGLVSRTADTPALKRRARF